VKEEFILALIQWERLDSPGKKRKGKLPPAGVRGVIEKGGGNIYMSKRIRVVPTKGGEEKRGGIVES